MEALVQKSCKRMRSYTILCLQPNTKTPLFLFPPPRNFGCDTFATLVDSGSLNLADMSGHPHYIYIYMQTSHSLYKKNELRRISSMSCMVSNARDRGYCLTWTAASPFSLLDVPQVRRTVLSFKLARAYPLQIVMSRETLLVKWFYVNHPIASHKQ